MDHLHSLLKRQLKKHFGEEAVLPKEWDKFLEVINNTYQEFDEDRNLLEHVLELNSAELMQSNSEMKAIFETLPNLLIRVDQEKIIDCKIGQTFHCCFKANEVIGSKIEVIPFEKKNIVKFKKAIKQVLLSKKSTNFEYEQVKNGNKEYYNAKFIPFLKEQVIIFVNKITEIKQAELSLKEHSHDLEEKIKTRTTDLIASEEKYRLVVENASEGILIAQDGIIKFFNRKFAEMTGFAQEDLINTPFLPLIHPDDREIVYSNHLKRINHIIKSDENNVYQFRSIVKSGETKFLELSTVLISWDNNPATLNFITDISIRKQNEEALQSSEERYSLFSELTQEGIFLYDNATIIDANTAVCKMLQASYEDIIGQNFMPVIPSKYHAVVIEKMRMKESTPYEIELIRKDGSTFWAEITRKNFTHKDQEIKVVSVRDITESKKSQQALQASEKQYRTLVENIPMGIYRATLDIEGKIIMANDLFWHIFGYNSEEDRQNFSLSKLYYNINDRIIFLEKLKKEKSITNLEVQLKTKDGSIMWESVRATIIYNEIGEALYYDGMIEDITEKKKIEEALKISEQRYRSLVENISVGLYRATLGVDGKIIVANNTFIKMFGFKKENEVKNIPMYNLYFNKKDRTSFSDLLLASGNLKNIELKLKKKNGALIWASIRANVVYNDDGQALYYDGMIEDITEKKLVNEKLTEYYEKLQDFQQALENTLNSIIITNKEGNIEYVNTGFEKTMGYCKDEVIGKNSTLLQAKNPESSIYKKIDKMLKEKQTWSGELCNKKKNGELIWEKVTVSPVFDKNNNLHKFITVKQDITEEKQLKEQLIDSFKKLQELDKRKDDFISVASHELRTPMSVIKGFSSLFLDGALGDINEQQKAYLLKIYNNTCRLIHLVNDMLDLNKLEAGKMEMKTIDIDINDFVKDCIYEFQPMYKSKNITLTYHSSLELASVLADENKLKQVFTNLLSNAFKFTHQDGNVKILISNYADNHNFVLVQVQDSGVGISKEQMSKIFEKFAQVDNYLQRESEGTGLGLAIVKEIIQKLQGDIWVESEIKQGSTFNFILPKK